MYGNSKEIPLAYGIDAYIPFAPIIAANISGQTLEVRFYRPVPPIGIKHLVLTLSPIESPIGGRPDLDADIDPAVGKFVIFLSSANNEAIGVDDAGNPVTQAAARINYELWRTDAGFRDQLGTGTVAIQPSTET